VDAIVVLGTTALEVNIMRNVIVATALALSPIVLHAQANSPAQPQVLQSKLVQPNEFKSAESNGTPSAAPARVTTGVAAPKLIHTVDVSSDGDWAWVSPIEKKVVVGMIVDATGKPSDLKIVQSAGMAVDKNVLAAVSQYRFKPGTLDHQAIAVPVNLEVVIRNSER
jgi:TonB family protein